MFIDTFYNLLAILGIIIVAAMIVVVVALGLSLSGLFISAAINSCKENRNTKH